MRKLIALLGLTILPMISQATPTATADTGDKQCASGTFSSQDDGRLRYCSNGQWLIPGAAFEGALFTTQVLAASVCHEKANLDPLKLAQHSSAMMFLLAVRSIYANGVMPAVTPADVLAQRISELKCDEAGILQMASSEQAIEDVVGRAADQAKAAGE